MISPYENLSCKLFQTSIALSTQRMLCAIKDDKDQVIYNNTIVLHRSHVENIRPILAGCGKEPSMNFTLLLKAKAMRIALAHE